MIPGPVFVSAVLVRSQETGLVFDLRMASVRTGRGRQLPQWLHCGGTFRGWEISVRGSFDGARACKGLPPEPGRFG